MGAVPVIQCGVAPITDPCDTATLRLVPRSQPDDVPAAARRLIDEHIHSVEQLEVLLLLRATPGKAWVVDEVARAMVSQRDTAGQRLRDLSARKLIRRQGDTFTYAPDPATDRAVSELATAYASRRTRVVALIFSKPSDAVLGFSDAFRLRRDE